jgi:hypothetical protein
MAAQFIKDSRSMECFETVIQTGKRALKDHSRSPERIHLPTLHTAFRWTSQEKYFQANTVQTKLSQLHFSNQNRMKRNTGNHIAAEITQHSNETQETDPALAQSHAEK